LDVCVFQTVSVSQFLNYIAIANILLRFELLLITTFPIPISCYCYTFTFTARLYLYDNQLTGTMPSEICALRDAGTLIILAADCTNITCPCCTQCYPGCKPYCWWAAITIIVRVI